MKVFANKISKVIDKLSGTARYIKTEPYPADSVNFTQHQVKKLTFGAKLKKFFTFSEPEITPQTFKSLRGYPHKPYVASHESVALSNKYCKNDYLSPMDKIINGYRDAGREVRFSKFGEAIGANREVIVIDTKYDEYLTKVIDYVVKNTNNMSENRKLKYIFNFIQKIGGDADKGEKLSHQFMPGKEILLGRIFEAEAACCRHKSLLFKILAQKTGLQAGIRRGMQLDFGGYGGHAWNEVVLSNGKKLLVDTQNNKIIDISKRKTNAAANCYLDCNLHGIY